VASTRARKSISEKTRAEDEKLREQLRKADIGKLKRALKSLMPVIAPTKRFTEKSD
jgi:hypothetical protein